MSEKPSYSESQKKEFIKAFDASGLSMNAWTKLDGNPSYPAFKRWYTKHQGMSGQAEAVTPGEDFDVTALLADSVAKLNAGKQSLLNRKDALHQQLKDIDAEIIKINAALEKLS